MSKDLKLYTIKDDTKPLTEQEVMALVGSQIRNLNEPISMQQNFMKSANFVSGSAGWKIDAEGNLEANDGTFRGDIEANSINIPNATTPLFSVDSAGVVTASDITITGGAVSGVPISGIPNSVTTDISLLEMSHDLVFSVTDADTIAWATGTISLSNGRTFSIDAGNTGNMTALTYIYLDPVTSSTVLQITTTYSTAVGANKRLIGVAQNQTTTASFIPYGPGQSLIDGDNIGANSIVAGNMAANSITATAINVANLAAINADMGTITAGSININNLSFINSNGQATFIGVSTLNMKVYTCFETAGRFIETQAGSGSATFGNQGVTVAPGVTATSYDKLLWWITGTVFNNNPTFTCSLLCLGGFETGDGVGFIGLGNPTISGNGFTETGTNYCGFEFKKATGVTTVIAVQCDGGGTVTYSGTLQTLTDGDYLELFIKKNSTTNIDYYTRLNGGDLSAVTTLSATLPSGSDTYIQFSSSNKGTTANFQIQLQTAAYEH